VIGYCRGATFHQSAVRSKEHAYPLEDEDDDEYEDDSVDLRHPPLLHRLKPGGKMP
jgi:hypothetical protein